MSGSEEIKVIQNNVTTCIMENCHALIDWKRSSHFNVIYQNFSNIEINQDEMMGNGEV